MYTVFRKNVTGAVAAACTSWCHRTANNGVFSPVCFELSVPVQVIAWKDSSPKWPVMCRAGRKTLLSDPHSLPKMLEKHRLIKLFPHDPLISADRSLQHIVMMCKTQFPPPTWRDWPVSSCWQCELDMRHLCFIDVVITAKYTAK